ncbi:MgtC/SapB family protein [Bythopirellula polymerisocia]|uniref:Putative Mg(2+) transport ATPase n=1 Tax=Bythopirellula polymerisocia TaxID=2528003 RepID=A0A5C6CSZ0_9BACT|nr:MgtC/SapB family protein [Bythopirellula polymerisocia]TWU27652.1 putative Mg(2+) transport ATPase [Bythopirellula polymerisocia]
MDEIGPYEVVVRVLGGAFFGGILGWESEVSEKPAGLRTNMLVAIGAATATLAALGLYNSLSGSRPAEQINSDPIRIISGVIGGLGFLGAGSIIQSRGEVQGITTAATIWVVGGIGIACGLGNYVLALTSAIITFVVLFVIGKFEVSSLAPENLQNSDRKSVQLKSENESEN